MNAVEWGRLLALGLLAATLCRADMGTEVNPAVQEAPAAPGSTLVSAARMKDWLERARAHNAQLLRIVQQLKQSGDVDSARVSLEALIEPTRKLAADGDAIAATAEAEGIPLHARRELLDMLSDYRLKLETQDAELAALIGATAPLQKFPGLQLFIHTFSINVQASDFLHADTQKRLKEYAPKAFALAQELSASLDHITDAASAAEMAVRYAELQRELSVCVGIINNYISYDPEGAMQGGLCDQIKKTLAEHSKAFAKKLPRLAAADYYGCEPLRSLLAPIVARNR